MKVIKNIVVVILIIFATTFLTVEEAFSSDVEIMATLICVGVCAAFIALVLRDKGETTKKEKVHKVSFMTMIVSLVEIATSFSAEYVLILIFVISLIAYMLTERIDNKNEKYNKNSFIGIIALSVLIMFGWFMKEPIYATIVYIGFVISVMAYIVTDRKINMEEKTNKHHITFLIMGILIISFCIFIILFGPLVLGALVSLIGGLVVALFGVPIDEGMPYLFNIVISEAYTLNGMIAIIVALSRYIVVGVIYLGMFFYKKKRNMKSMI